MLEQAETAATAMQKIVRGRSSRRQSDPKTPEPLTAMQKVEQGGGRAGVLRALLGALERELEAELASEIGISRWEPLQALCKMLNNAPCPIHQYPIHQCPMPNEQYAQCPMH